MYMYKLHGHICTVYIYIVKQTSCIFHFLCPFSTFSLSTAQSALLIMDSEGYISLYTLPDLRLICREDCVDATDAVGQRNFVCSSIGVILHQRSPSEFTRDSLTEEGRLEVNFSVPLKTVTPLKLTPATSRNNLVDQLPTPLDMQVKHIFVHDCIYMNTQMLRKRERDKATQHNTKPETTRKGCTQVGLEPTHALRFLGVMLYQLSY